jgi:hypothetical protein
MKHHKWSPNYPVTNSALDYVNRRQRRRLYQLKLRSWLVRHVPRLDRSPKANHLLRASDCYGIVTPPKNPKPRGEYELILWQRAHYEHDESA